MTSRYRRRTSRQTDYPRVELDEAEQSISQELLARWNKLLQYYHSAITADNAGEVELFSSQEGKSFIRAPSLDGQEWITSGREGLEIPLGEQTRDFLAGPRWSRAPVSYFYGYPCFTRYIRQSKKGWTGAIVQPVLIFPVSRTQTENGSMFLLESDRPRLNAALLSRYGLATGAEEKRHLAETMLEAWDETRSGGENLRAMISKLRDFLSLSGEIPIPAEIAEGRSSQAPWGEGREIVATGVLFYVRDSTYTVGLEQELSELLKGSAPNDVWQTVIERAGGMHESGIEGLISVTPLNEKQKSVVASAFQNQLTVVTGPPGTGKSQIVMNIVANALIRGESVLFGSKNHRAVDVVIERLVRFQKEPLILKYGQRDREAEFAESLLDAVDRSFGFDLDSLKRDAEGLASALATIHDEEQKSWETLQHVLARRNEISRLDSELERIQEKLPPYISSQLNKQQPLPYSREFIQELEKLGRLIRKHEVGGSLVDGVLRLFGQSLEKRIDTSAACLRALFPLELNQRLPLGNVRRAQESALVAGLLKEWADTRDQCTVLVQENASEPKIDSLRGRIEDAREQAVAVGSKYADVLMRIRLRSLPPEIRRDIADYVSIVRRLEEDVTGGELAEMLRRERKRMFKAVVKVFPSMAVTNLSVRHALPLQPGIVDIVVIDEASQSDIASALPLLFRAKRAVIIGDPHQLTHISSLHSADDQQLQRKFGLSAADDQRFLYSIESLFHLARTVVGSGARFVHLREHYRSRSEIIEYSNQSFYGGQLSVWTDYRQLKGSGAPMAVVWHDVVGEVIRPSQGSAYNLEEARHVVALLGEIVEKVADNHVSVGVVTPFREQANKIRDMVEKSFDRPTLARLDFVADTAHRYQGDQRDIMIFSPVVSRRTPERSLGFLGSTMNLFNVAITRARAELHIVGDREACANSGIPHLVGFTEYVQSLAPERSEARGGFQSPWEKALFDALADAGIRTIPQYVVHQYQLDLAIPETNPPIDIEIDGEMWHRDIDGSRLADDIKRDLRLSALGWQVKRFWVYELQYDIGTCVEEIRELLQSKDGS